MHLEIIYICAIVVNEESDRCSSDSGSDSDSDSSMEEAPRGCNLMKASTEIECESEVVQLSTRGRGRKKPVI